jgi:predicted metalloendopeptidase
MRSHHVWICALAAACGSSKSSKPSTDHGSGSGSAMVATGSGSGSGSAAGSAAEATPAPSVDTAGMDTSVKPGDDFFEFTNGAWLKSTEIPPDQSRWGGFSILTELTTKRTAELIKDAAASATAGSDARKIGDYFAAFMDEAAIEAKGAKPLEPELAAIDKITDAKSLATALGATIRADVDVLNATRTSTPNLFGVWIAQDLDDPSRYVPFILQGGLRLPDREFYLDKAPRMADIRTKYEAHIVAVLDLAKVPDAAAKAKRILDLETKIATVHAPRVDTSDVHKGDNHWKRAELATKAPGLDWDSFLAAAMLDKQADFVIWHPHAVTGIAALVKSVPIGTWKEWLAFHAIERAAPVLSKAFVDESFAFYGGVLSGVPKLADRWKRAVNMTDAALGDAVGKLYVAKHFPPEAKAKAKAMVANEIAAFATRIDKLTWMAPATKAKAKAKLAALKVGVGYPDNWRDYSGLEVAKDDAFGNAERSSLFGYKQRLARLGQPVDRDEWVMVPQLINAVNMPAMNALNFPAAIMQPPFFDVSWPDVRNYGAMGAVIGHEISHSFDDQGALFDDTGKLQNWWTPEDLAHFKASAKKLIEQFNTYKPFPDLAVNGALTVSENIADVAGLSVAYDAYRMSLAGKEAPAAAGFSGDQQFFIAFGQAWRAKTREPAARARILTDGHAPPQYRAATVRNIDAWYDAFQVKPTDKLALGPQARVKVW